MVLLNREQWMVAQHNSIPAMASLNFVWLVPSTEEQKRTQGEKKKEHVIKSQEKLWSKMFPLMIAKNYGIPAVLSQLTAEWAATVRQMVTLAIQVMYSSKFYRYEKRKNLDNNTYHLEQPSEQESHTYRFRTRKVQLVAQRGSKNKIKQIWTIKKKWYHVTFNWISILPFSYSS